MVKLFKPKALRDLSSVLTDRVFDEQSSDAVADACCRSLSRVLAEFEPDHRGTVPVPSLISYKRQIEITPLKPTRLLSIMYAALSIPKNLGALVPHVSALPA